MTDHEDELARVIYEAFRAQGFHVGDYRFMGLPLTTIDGKYDLSEIARAVHLYYVRKGWSPPSSPDLDDLVSKITDENRHPEL